MDGQVVFPGGLKLVIMVHLTAFGLNPRHWLLKQLVDACISRRSQGHVAPIMRGKAKRQIGHLSLTLSAESSGVEALGQM